MLTEAFTPLKLTNDERKNALAYLDKSYVREDSLQTQSDLALSSYLFPDIYMQKNQKKKTIQDMIARDISITFNQLDIKYVLAEGDITDSSTFLEDIKKNIFKIFDRAFDYTVPYQGFTFSPVSTYGTSSIYTIEYSKNTFTDTNTNSYARYFQITDAERPLNYLKADLTRLYMNEAALKYLQALGYTQDENYVDLVFKRGGLFLRVFMRGENGPLQKKKLTDFLNNFSGNFAKLIDNETLKIKLG